MDLRDWALGLALGALVGCGPVARPKVVVLGLDGCDPNLLRQLIGQGKLPHFARLQKQGGLWDLATSNPPQSPVAWATFITGLDPGGHGLYDFLHRDPQKLCPITSMSSVVEGKARLERGGKPFWDYLTQAGVPVTLLRVPCHYPAPRDGARSLTGLGTPDLLGSYGTYTYYSEDKPRDIQGGQWVRVEARQEVVEASLIGPAEASLPLRLNLDREHAQLLLETQQQRMLLRQGEWSPWVSVRFGSAAGLVRFYLANLKPLGLYASPVNIDPARPSQAISNPRSFAPHLARCCGNFHTQAMAEDTKALGSGVLDDRAYLEQSRSVLQENRLLLRQGLREFHQGLLFFYFSHLDLQSHMFWTRDSQVILKAYQDLDEALGEVMAACDQQTTLWVLSDHGFAPFRRVFDLNRWLVGKGWMSIQPGQTLDQTNWAQTRAYAVGFNGLYLNLKGRESQGTVTPQQREQLLGELSEQLLTVTDPQTGQRVVRQVYRSQDIYASDYRQRAPDLIIGYARGYRCSWESALGGSSKTVLSDNREHWCGDHLMDPGEVPGVLLCSRPLAQTQASLIDLAPTLLRQFQVAPPAGWKGKNLLEE